MSADGEHGAACSTSTDSKASGFSQWGPEVEVRGQFETGESPYVVEKRASPRFRLEVSICIYPRGSAVMRGRTVDISLSGVAILVSEPLALGEVVRLEFTLPHGQVDTYAMVRQRNAFRYGLQFLEGASAHDAIGRTCRELAMDQAVCSPFPPKLAK